MLNRSGVSDSLQQHWTAAHQTPLFMGFSRRFWISQNIIMCCHFLLQGNLPYPGIDPGSFVSLALAGRFFTTAPPGKPMQYGEWTLKNKLQLRKLLFKKNVHLVSSNLLQPPKQWRRPESWFWRAENCSCKSHKNLGSNPAWPFSTSIPLVSYWVVLRPGFPVCKSGKIRLTFQCCHEASKW